MSINYYKSCNILSNTIEKIEINGNVIRQIDVDVKIYLENQHETTESHYHHLKNFSSMIVYTHTLTFNKLQINGERLVPII